MTQDLVELLIAGAPIVCRDKVERFQMLINLVEYLRKHRVGDAADAIREHVIDNKDECLEAGVCPYCGESVVAEERNERHDAQFGSGTVVERRGFYVCQGTCGEV